MTALVYFFGFIGLASIGLVPLRSWQVLRGFLGNDVVQQPGKLSAVLAVLVAAAAVWGDVQITNRIFKCLTQTYCGPGLASGWSYLAMLGVVYLVFEAAVFVLRRVGRVKTTKPVG